MKKHKTMLVDEIIANVTAFVLHSIEGQYVQCKTDLLKPSDYEYFENLGAKVEVLNEYRTRFYFVGEYRIIEE